MNILIAIIALVVLSLLFGALLGYAAIRFRPEGDPVIDQIDAILPQSQCAQCGHPGCRPYATAIAAGEAPINKCVPGGQPTVDALADLLDVESMTLDAEEGAGDKPKQVAVIREKECIGCTKCLQACPVDAIVGAAKQMHTVIESECTGCDLCVDPCPVDCIDLVPMAQSLSTWSWPQPETDYQIIATDRKSENAA